MNNWGTHREVEKVTRSEEDAASEDYPSIELVISGHRLHVFAASGEWQVWLNTEALDFDGLCIGVGHTRDAAVADAVRALEAAVATLQGPEPIPS